MGNFPFSKAFSAMPLQAHRPVCLDLHVLDREKAGVHSTRAVRKPASLDSKHSKPQALPTPVEAGWLGDTKVYDRTPLAPPQVGEKLPFVRIAGRQTRNAKLTESTRLNQTVSTSIESELWGPIRTVNASSKPAGTAEQTNPVVETLPHGGCQILLSSAPLSLVS